MAEEVFGFKRNTAEKLMASIGVVANAPTVRGNAETYHSFLRYGKTTTAITSGGTGTVAFYGPKVTTPYVVITADEVTAYSPFVAVPDDTNVWMCVMYGEWHVFEVC